MTTLTFDRPLPPEKISELHRLRDQAERAGAQACAAIPTQVLEAGHLASLWEVLQALARSLSGGGELGEGRRRDLTLALAGSLGWTPLANPPPADTRRVKACRMAVRFATPEALERGLVREMVSLGMWARRALLDWDQVGERERLALERELDQLFELAGVEPGAGE